MVPTAWGPKFFEETNDAPIPKGLAIGKWIFERRTPFTKKEVNYMSVSMGEYRGIVYSEVKNDVQKSSEYLKRLAFAVCLLKSLNAVKKITGVCRTTIRNRLKNFACTSKRLEEIVGRDFLMAKLKLNKEQLKYLDKFIK